MGRPIPIIAAVNGAAYAVGCANWRLACDFIYAAEHSRFALTEVTGCGWNADLNPRRGRTPSERNHSHRQALHGCAGLQWGLVNRVLSMTDLLPEALSTAEVIARNAPISVRQAKQAIARGLNMSLSDGLVFETEARHAERAAPSAKNTIADAARGPNRNAASARGSGSHNPEA